MSRKEAESLIPESGSVIISISDSYNYPAQLSDKFIQIKRLNFLDGVYGEDSIKQFGPNFSIAFHNFFRKPHAEEIIQFLHSLDISMISTLYVHCKAGESRSAAVAKYISDVFHIPAYKLQFGVLHQDQLFQKANSLVYQLLCNPTCFDRIIYSSNPYNIKHKNTSDHSTGTLLKIAKFFGFSK